MQYSFHKENDSVNVVLSDTLVDLVYKTQVAQEIGLLGVTSKIEEIEQEKQIQEAFKDIIDWVKKNVVEYKYASQIINRITYALKYGVSTSTKNAEQNQSISFVSSNNDNYSLFISKENNVLSVQTDEVKSNNKLSTSIVVNLNSLDDKGNKLHSTIEETVVTTRLYEIDNITYKNIDSTQETRFYQTRNKVSHTISKKMETTQIVNDPKNENNNAMILKDQRHILTKYPCKGSNIIACAYKEYNFNNNSYTNNSYYLSRNNGINDLRLETNNAKCPISLKLYKAAIQGKLDVEKLVEMFEIESFTHIANYPEYTKGRRLQKKDIDAYIFEE